ncbi:universal stress protein [Nonlabens mediterrranea]|uniref:Universal stress protein n=1 Tax=Nonlabens mediterrranea TaxID=1419947 RepID=A0ABS0A2T2_9FLAO|nr:universal stress protein [Nonlabens mediterrranea]
MKKILLPTDFSIASVNAIEYAVQLFKNDDCHFYVLNTYEPVALYTSTTYGNDPGLDLEIGELFKKKSKEHVKKVIDEVQLKYNNARHTFQGISNFNMLSIEVNELVKDYEIDLIVMGTNGASGLKEVFIGSQTMHVIKNAKVPVIGVPQNYSYKQPKEILFTTDYKTNEEHAGIELLEEICNSNISRLIFLNAYEGNSLTPQQVKNMNALDAFFKRDAHLTQIAKGMDVLEAMEDFQSRHGIDLLVLVHNHHNFFENLLFKPVVKRVVHRSSVPFLILPA